MDEIDKSLRDLEDSAERFEKNLVSHFDDRKNTRADFKKSYFG